MSALGEWTARNLDSLFAAVIFLALGCSLLFAPRKMLRRVMPDQPDVTETDWGINIARVVGVACLMFVLRVLSLL